MTPFPPNFIPIVDAFNQAVDRLSPQIAAGRGSERPQPGRTYRLRRHARRILSTERRGGKASREAVSGRACRWLRKGVGQESGDRAMEELIDAVSGREAWRQMAVGIPGFELRTHHLTNPGPNDERPIFIERGQFEAWIGMAAKQLVIETRQEALVAEIPIFVVAGRRWPLGAMKIALYQECDRQLGVPSLENDKAWRTTADANKFVLDSPQLERRKG